MNTISNFHSSLYILHKCYENLETTFFVFNKYQTEGIESYSNPILPSVRDYMILEATSFLDEYNNNFLEINNRTVQTGKKKSIRQNPIENEYWSRIENLDKVIQPLLKMIYRWTEIHTYRNNHVGHGNRSDYNKGNKLLIAGQEMYDAPRNISEFRVMRDIIHLIFGFIAQEFKQELIDADFFAGMLKPIVNPLKDNSKIETELSSMILEVEEEIKMQGKDYTLNIPHLAFEQLKELVSNMSEFHHPVTLMNDYRRNNHEQILAKIKEDFLTQSLKPSTTGKNKNTPR